MNAAPLKLSDAAVFPAVLVHVEAAWPAAPEMAQHKLARAVTYRVNGCPVSVAVALYVIDQTAIGIKAGAWPGADDIYVAADLVHSALDFAWSGVPVLALVGLGMTLRSGHAPAVGIDVAELP